VESSEGIAGWVWGMAKPGAQKKSRTAGETKRRAEGAVLSVEENEEAGTRYRG
jgi:hypothetical protein